MRIRDWSSDVCSSDLVNIRWLDAEMFENEDHLVEQLEPMHGILVPGGFGERGSDGKIASVKFARERNVPFFGICLGMQMACIEGARNMAGLAKRSEEHTSELQSLMRISYAVFCLKKKQNKQ